MRELNQIEKDVSRKISMEHSKWLENSKQLLDIINADRDVALSILMSAMMGHLIMFSVCNGADLQKVMQIVSKEFIKDHQR